MTNPLWPDPATPFKLFGTPGEANAATPLTQGFAGGMDLLKKFWGNLPGGTAVPGFLVPTVDVDELDKRLSDLRAAESWVEVNLNMLRATIQGLEVQRNTISAIHSLSAMAEGVMAGRTPAPARPDVAATGLPAGWPIGPATAAAPAAPVESAAPAESAPPASEPAPASGAVDPMVSLATHNWLGFMQQQFMKVAQAAVAPPKPDGAGPQGVTRAATRKPAVRSTTAPASRKAKRRTPAAR